MNITKLLLNKAKSKKRNIVFPEAGFSERIIEACKIIQRKGIANVILIGDESALSLRIKDKDLDQVQIYNPKTFANIDKMAEIVYEKRKSKGLTMEEAYELIQDPIYFAVSLIEMGYADGMVCGAEVSTAKTLRPALQIIKSKEGIVSSYFLFIGKNKVTDNVFMMGDCAVVENPTAKELCAISELMLEENKNLGLFDPRFAFLSYSTLGSAKSENVTKVQEAYNLFKERNSSVQAVGEVQLDASIKENVAKTKMPSFKWNGPANMFVMPNIEAGNIGYKLIQYFGGVQAIGPITMGFNKPVNDLSRGCSVEDIILVTAITAIQCK